MSDNVSPFPKMTDTEAELARERTLREAYATQLQETKEERDRIEGKWNQMRERLTELSLEWATNPENNYGGSYASKIDDLLEEIP